MHIIPTCRSKKIGALNSHQFDELLDEDGRLIDEHALRQAVFLGGSDPHVRRQVWQFLFGLYPCTSTAREREVLLMENIVKYHELKSRWRMMLVAYSNPSGDKNPHLGHLRDILITYTAFHPKIGYAQGMNDIIARFLAVFDSEVEAYWCFKHYMDSVELEFLEDGMLHKINLVQKLLEELDPALQEHLNRYELGDLLFCHRWLLLGFKREFNFDDSLKCFEILSSHHLELSSLAAENTRRREMLKDFENQDGEQRTVDQDVNAEYTFELFMCVALLMQLREQLLKCTDAAMIFQCINSLTMDLDSVLHRSEQLFYHYCKKSVEDCFVLIDMPKVKNKKHLLNWKT